MRRKITKAGLLIHVIALIVINTTISCKKLPEKVSDLTQPEADSIECVKWKNNMSSLSKEETEKLVRDNAIFTNAGLILNDSLIKDCRLREEMATYFGRVLAGNTENKKQDEEFAAQHSAEIVAVIRKIWPSLSNSKALIRDGSFNSEKYGLLADPALAEPDIAPLISDILDAETIDNDVAFILFSRPMPGVKQAIVRLQKTAQDIKSIPMQIMTLAILRKMGDPSALPKLKTLLRKPHLTAFESKTLRTLITKSERGEEITFSDVEDIEYMNETRVK